METPPAAATMVPAAPTAAAVATTANNPITMTAVAVRQRLDVQALHAKALEQLVLGCNSVDNRPDNTLWQR